MKKIVLLIVLSLMLATHGYAACAEGTEVTGKNGHVYCKSNIGMNWYTAFLWCEAQGRTLVTPAQACDIDETQKWDGNRGVGKCLNMMDISPNFTAWTAMPYLDQSLGIQTSTGNIDMWIRTAYAWPALCW